MKATKFVNKTNLSREDWLEARKLGIGGSDAPAVAGVHRWKSRLEVFLEKVGQIDPPEENEKMYWGNVLESVVADEFTRRTGKKVEKVNFILQHPEHDFMLANIDRRVVGEKAGLECKTASEWSGQNIIENDFLPEHLLQAQHYLAVTGWDRWYLACLIGGQKFIWREVLPDPEIIEYLIKIEGDFWKLVEAGTPPEADGSEACTEFLNRRYQKSNNEGIELPSDSIDLIEQYNKAKDEEKRQKTLKDEAANKIKVSMGENEKGFAGQYVVSWKSQTRNTVDSKTLKAKYPDIAAEVMKESISRPFDVKEAKE